MLTIMLENALQWLNKNYITFDLVHETKSYGLGPRACTSTIPLSNITKMIIINLKQHKIEVVHIKSRKIMLYSRHIDKKCITCCWTGCL